MGRRKGRPLSHAEVWDDSALLQSWDDALAEYKTYHSVGASGEDVETLLNTVEAAAEAHDESNDPNEIASDVVGEVAGEELEDGELDETTEAQSGQGEAIETQHVGSAAVNVDPPAAATKPLPSVVEGIMNSVGDEALKNLMMSWYYAGYYTGLYQSQNTATKPLPD